MTARRVLTGVAVLALGGGVLASVVNAALPCGRRACSDEAAASGLTDDAGRACLKSLISDCSAGLCSCTGGSPPCSCVCGDGLCGPSEDCGTCPQDCGTCPTTTTTTTTTTTSTTGPSCSGWGGGCDTGLPGSGTGTCCTGLTCVRQSQTSDYGLCAGATCILPSDCPGGDCAGGLCCSVFGGECALGCCPGLECGSPNFGTLEICLEGLGSPCMFDFQCSRGYCDPSTMTCQPRG
jgi:hypothetical protein